MPQKIKIENGTNFNCFVPSCASKKNIDGIPIHFFQVPDGNDGLRWKLAVNSDRAQREKGIGILRNIPSTTLYCCELHFNVKLQSNILAPCAIVEFNFRNFFSFRLKPIAS